MASKDAGGPTAAPEVRCPFCGASITDRFELEGHRFLVFACMFTPEVAPEVAEADLEAHLRGRYAASGPSGYFRGMCDRLHFFVTKGAGARALNAPADEGASG
jgi:hypothetical protein